MIGNNSLLAWDLRLCWLLRKGKLCTEGFELEMFFLQKDEKGQGKGKLNEIAVVLHLARWQRI